MIADLYGLPASGKTTLVRALAQEPGSCILPPRRGREVPKAALILNMCMPEYWGFLLRCRRLYAAKHQVDKAADELHLVALRRVYLICMWERKRKEAYHCFDGIIQYITSMVWTEYDLEQQGLDLIAYYLKHMRGGIKTVYTRNQDPEAVYCRMEQRGEDRRMMRDMTREQGLALMRFQASFFEKVWQMSEQMGLGALVDTGLPLEESCAAMRTQLQIERREQNAENRQ